MPARVTLFCGNTQQGKSTLALWLALREWPRVIVLDSARARVFDRISAGGHFATWRELARWLRDDAAAFQRWAVTLRSKDPADYAAALRCAEHMRRVLIVCDEAHKLVRMDGVREPMELVALTGAHFGGGAGVGLYMATPRPGSVPINIRSQAERVITFRQREPRDIAWLAEWSGNEEWAASVAGLADHCHTTWPAETITVRTGHNDEVAAMGDGGGRHRVGGGRAGADVSRDVRATERHQLHSEGREVSAGADAVGVQPASDAAA